MPEFFNNIFTFFKEVYAFFDTIIFRQGIVGTYVYNNLDEQPNLMILGVASIIFMLVAGYLLGSINFAIIISKKIFREDIRTLGSKNAGMTNMMRNYGKKAAAMTLLGDMLKAIIACMIGYAIGGQGGAWLAGMASVFGHVFPIFYKFKGGKGVVTALMTMMMCDFATFIIMMVLFVTIVATTKYLSLGSIMIFAMGPFIHNGLFVFSEKINHPENPQPVSDFVLIALVFSMLIVLKHSGNIKRLLDHTESKFSFKKSVKPPAKDAENE